MHNYLDIYGELFNFHAAFFFKETFNADIYEIIKTHKVLAGFIFFCLVHVAQSQTVGYKGLCDLQIIDRPCLDTFS